MMFFLIGMKRAFEDGDKMVELGIEERIIKEYKKELNHAG